MQTSDTAFVSAALRTFVLIFLIHLSTTYAQDVEGYEDIVKSASITYVSNSKSGQTQRSIEFSTDPNDVHFRLYKNASNPRQFVELIYNNRTSIQRSGFKSNLNVVFIIHGFQVNGTEGMSGAVKRSYLSASQFLPLNVIVVDWGKISTPNNVDGYVDTLLAYYGVVRNLFIVYRRVAAFIQFLVNNRYTTLEKIHLVGHSLGAHISGYAGGILRRDNNGQGLARISGLDPPGLNFSNTGLNKTNAEFVDVYHTSILGDTTRRGNADFFPNGGGFQPGCSVFDPSCSHSFVWKIYAKSISQQYCSCQCVPAFQNNNPRCPGGCERQAVAGQMCTPDTIGEFEFNTTDNANPLPCEGLL